MRRCAFVLAVAWVVEACSPASMNGDGAQGDATLDGVADAPSDDVVATDAQDAPTILDAPAGDPLSWDLRMPGPFNVGYRTLTTTYTPRGSTATRTLTLHVWYPTLATTGRHPRYANLFLDSLTLVEAPLASSPFADHQYPVHAFSHGHRGFAGNAWFLMRHFASHGWIAIGPDHLGNTIDNSPDPLPINIQYLRALDMSATLDALDRLPMSDPLAGRTRTMRALLSGHSFGTHTVWSAAGATFDVTAIAARCMPAGTCTMADLDVFRAGVREPRFVAAIPMAGSIRTEWFGSTGHTSVMIPIFAMSGSADPVGADTQWTNTAPMPLTWIDVRGACHQFFGFGGCAEIPDALQTPIVGTYALALGRRAVLMDMSAGVTDVLEGRSMVSDRVTFQRR